MARGWMGAAVAVLFAMSLCACGAPPSYEFRPRDPRQVVLRTLHRDGTPRVVLGAGQVRPGVDQGRRWSAQDASGSGLWRDEQGFPHVCFRAHYLVTGDGRIVVTGEQRPDRQAFIVRVDLLRFGWCHRPLRRCWWPDGSMEMVTPYSNLMSLRIGAGNDE